MLIRLNRDSGANHPDYAWAEDEFAAWPEEGEPEAGKGAIAPLAKLLAEGEALFAEGRPLGVVVNAGEDVEALEPWLDRLALVALDFPKFLDGRQFSAAALLRERYRYTGELRAVGDVLREQAWAMARVGIDSFAPIDGSTPEDWTHAVNRWRHVYQRAEDGRAPIWEERLHG